MPEPVKQYSSPYKKVPFYSKAQTFSSSTKKKKTSGKKETNYYIGPEGISTNFVTNSLTEYISAT